MGLHGLSFARACAIALILSLGIVREAIPCNFSHLAGKAVRYVTRQTTPSENGVPVEWHQDRQPTRQLALTPPAGKSLAESTIPDLFLQQARRDPDRVLLIDEVRGPLTYRDVVMGVYLLKPAIEALGREPNVGVLLPASAGATVTMLATQFAGRTPAMINWTVGKKNIQAAIDTAGVNKILTSRAFMAEALKKFPDLKEFEDRFVYLEDFREAPDYNRRYYAAFAKSRFTRFTDLDTSKVPENAVILFTSGSSGTPKAVPLTHYNQIANVKDILEVVPIHEKDRVLGILPPFHSFGATGNVVLPLITGAKVAYYPNPLAGKSVAEAVGKYGATVILGTPTFLQMMARGAKPGQLDTLRVGIVGAERTTEKAAHAIGEKTPEGFKLLEAYGTTEAAPAVTINDPNAPVLGSIGLPLPSVEVRLVAQNDKGQWENVPAGEPGLLLIRGPNLFKGYLNFKGTQPFLTHEGKSWYDTGDIVVQDPRTGVLTIKGRANLDFEKIGGEMISFQAIVDVLNEKYDVKENTRFVVASDRRSDKPRLVLITTQEGLSTKDVNDAIVQGGLTNLYGIDRIVTLKEFPLLGTGKLDRKALKDLAEKD